MSVSETGRRRTRGRTSPARKTVPGAPPPDSNPLFVHRVLVKVKEAAHSFLSVHGYEPAKMTSPEKRDAVAKLLGHANPAGGPWEYMARCHRAGLLRIRR